MALDAALVRLRDELTRLRGLLRVLRAEARHGCPNRKHWVPERIYDIDPELRGLLRPAAAAARLAAEAVAVGGGAVPRAMLIRCDRSVAKFRRRYRASVPGAVRGGELKNLPRQPDLTDDERKRWKRWVKRVRPAVRAALWQVRAVRAAAADCWRELAAAPPAGAVVITNTNTVVAHPPGPDRGKHKGKRQ